MSLGRATRSARRQKPMALDNSRSRPLPRGTVASRRRGLGRLHRCPVRVRRLASEGGDYLRQHAPPLQGDGGPFFTLRRGLGRGKPARTRGATARPGPAGAPPLNFWVRAIRPQGDRTSARSSARAEPRATPPRAAHPHVRPRTGSRSSGGPSHAQRVAPGDAVTRPWEHRRSEVMQGARPVARSASPQPGWHSVLDGQGWVAATGGRPKRPQATAGERPTFGMSAKDGPRAVPPCGRSDVVVERVGSRLPMVVTESGAEGVSVSAVQARPGFRVVPGGQPEGWPGGRCGHPVQPPVTPWRPGTAQLRPCGVPRARPTARSAPPERSALQRTGSRHDTDRQCRDAPAPDDGTRDGRPTYRSRQARSAGLPRRS